MVGSLVGVPINHRDKGRVIAKKNGNALIRTLRATHGFTFAQGESNSLTLIDVIERLTSNHPLVQTEHPQIATRGDATGWFQRSIHYGRRDQRESFCLFGAD
jgi:hypothetical protein